MVYRSLLLSVGLGVASAVAEHLPVHKYHRKRQAVDGILSECTQGGENGVWALTFDDAVTEDSQTIGTSILAATTPEKSALGTFFVHGDDAGDGSNCVYSTTNVATLQALDTAGHQLASFGWSHEDLNALSQEELDEHIERLDLAFIKILGKKPNYFRHSYAADPNYVLEQDVIDRIVDYHGKIIVTSPHPITDIGNPPPTGQEVYAQYEDLIEASITLGTCPLKGYITSAHDGEQGTVDSIDDVVSTLVTDLKYQLLTVGQCNGQESSGWYTSATPAGGVVGVRDDTWTCEDPQDPPPTCLWHYKSRQGDTCESVAHDYDMDLATFILANPEIDCSKPICVDTHVCITTPKPQCKWYHISKAGETCWSIAWNFGLSVNKLHSLTPYLDCHDIWPHTPVCMPDDKPEDWDEGDNICEVIYRSTCDETCQAIENKFGMEPGLLKDVNGFIDCHNIWTNTYLCIPETNSECHTYLKTPTDRSTTCQEVGFWRGLNPEVIKYWNPFVNCHDIWPGTDLCVRHQRIQGNQPV